MAEQYCNRTLEGLLQLARYRRTIFFSFCVSHFAFFLVTSLGNLLVIRVLVKASSIPANVKKLFLSLMAFSDLAVGLVPQLMTGITDLCRDTEDSIKRRLQLSVTLSDSFKFVLILSLFFSAPHLF